jgi:hypothetical protein
MKGVLNTRKKFFQPTLLCGDRVKKVIFEVKIWVQRYPNNFLQIKAFLISLFAFVRGLKDANYDILTLV